MDCPDAIARLNALLDDRQFDVFDGRLADHLRNCPACADHASGCRLTLVGVDALREVNVPPMSNDFAERVVGAARLTPRDRRAERQAGGLFVAAMAVAAALLVAAWPIAGRRSVDEPPEPVHQVTLHQSRELQAPVVLPAIDTPRYREMLVATGRNLATIPATVRRATTGTEREGLTDTLRPVATSVGNTLEALLELLPPAERRAEMPNGDTGFYEPISPLVAV